MTTNLRSNKSIEAAVTKGLEAAMQNGVLIGIKLMSDENVPIEVISRVILDPLCRRQADWHGRI